MSEGACYLCHLGYPFPTGRPAPKPLLETCECCGRQFCPKCMKRHTAERPPWLVELVADDPRQCIGVADDGESAWVEWSGTAGARVRVMPEVVP